MSHLRHVSAFAQIIRRPHIKLLVFKTVSRIFGDVQQDLGSVFQSLHRQSSQQESDPRGGESCPGPIGGELTG